MPENHPLAGRKNDHLRINLEENVQSGLRSGLDDYAFLHRALPELDLDEVDLSLELFGRRLGFPLLVSSMTGGTEQAAQINRRLAEAAQEMKVALGVGSQRAALEDPAQAYTYQVRRYAPDVLLFANLGAVQLNYGYGLDHCRRAMEMIEADALFLHLNPLQEAVQPEGDTRFRGLLDKIAAVCRALPGKVVVKEVGWGISEEDARRLADVGVAGIDVAGAGGTSWSEVEMHRARSKFQAKLAGAFLNWGIPTVEALRNVRRAAPDLPVFASGGLRGGVDLAKCVALGASLGGMAGPFLQAANESVDDVLESMRLVRREMQVSMFAAGAGSLDALRLLPLQRR